MALVDVGQLIVKTMSRDLRHDVIEELCLILNPSLPLKDYRSLAGKMGLKYIYVKNLDRVENPTEKLLQHWWSEVKLPIKCIFYSDYSICDIFHFMIMQIN